MRFWVIIHGYSLRWRVQLLECSNYNFHIRRRCDRVFWELGCTGCDPLRDFWCDFVLCLPRPSSSPSSPSLSPPPSVSRAVRFRDGPPRDRSSSPSSPSLSSPPRASRAVRFRAGPPRDRSSSPSSLSLSPPPRVSRAVRFRDGPPRDRASSLSSSWAGGVSGRPLDSGDMGEGSRGGGEGGGVAMPKPLTSLR